MIGKWNETRKAATEYCKAQNEKKEKFLKKNTPYPISFFLSPFPTISTHLQYAIGSLWINQVDHSGSGV